MLLPSKGINYHFFRLAVAEDGSVRAVDWYVFLSGQWQSETLRQAFLPLANTWAKGGAHLIAPTEGQFVTHFHDIAAMVESYQKKDFEQVLQLYRALPESLQRHMMPFALRLGAAQALRGDEQRRALDDFRKFYPNDAAVDLIVFDDLVAKKSFDSALAGLDRIDKAVGGDPHLKVLRARVLLKQGKQAEAQKMAETAISEEPTLKGAYYFLTDRALQAKDFAKTAELLTTLETKCGVKFKDLTKVPAYREFVKSPEYKAWLKSHHKGG
jgi:tetratricopeptide (TPR) repeat protein